MEAPVIDVRDLSKSYGPVQAVKEVSFSVGGGEIVGLLGPNGAGKTTIMKILTCYLFPSRGTARVNGHDVFDEPLAVKECVGYLPESAPLYPDFTVREYLDFIADARQLTGTSRRERLAWVVEECGLAGVVDRGIDELSKGFRQRTGLAQAMLHDPRVLILDEPTTGLDPHQIIEIRELIRRLGREKTVILSTHILQEVEAVCQRILILNRGTIVAQGTREEIEGTLKGEVLLDLALKGAAFDAGAVAGLEGVRSVISARALPSGTTELRLSLAPDSGAEERLFDWAVARGLKILAMVPQRLSLEDIFITLTESSPGQGGAS